MTRTIEIEEARAHLEDLISSANGGDEILIAVNSQPVARLVALPAPVQKRIAGLGRGEIWISEDFDDPLPDEFWLESE